MLRAVLKGSVLAAFGYLPGGPSLYRTATRDLMGTQATHVDKLQRVWPDFLHKALCGHPLGYHNRLLPAEICHFFESAWFRQIAVRRLIYPDRRFVDAEDVLEGAPGLSRSLLSRRFRGISDADLRTAAAHYVYQKQ